MTKDFDNIDRDFDSRVRSMMEEGSMELPSGMWSAIEGRLDADAAKAVSVFARRRRRIAVWGGSFAAAASIALAVIFGGRTSGGDTLLAGQSSTRVSEPNHNQSLTNCSTGNDTGLETSVVSVGFSVAEGAEGARHVAAAYEIPSVAGDSKQNIAEEAAEVEADAVVTVGNSAEPAAEEKSVQHVEVAESGRWDGPEVDSEQRQLRYRRPAVSVWGNAVNPAARGNGQFSGTLAGVDFNPGVGIIESGDLSYLPPVEFGLGLRFALSERWSIGLGADYSLLSRKFTGLFLDPHDLPVSYTSIVNTQHWLGARANIYYSILSSDKVDFYVRAGAGAQWCLANDYAMKNDSRSDNWSSKVDATQFTVGAGFGIQYALGRRVAIYLDPSLNYWFKNEEVPKSSRTVSPLGFGAELGLRFQL